jgi:hypothetical protein
MSYITEGDLENLLLQDIDSSHSSFIASVISWVEAYIEQYCGIDFENSGSAIKYFDGHDTEDLYIGECQSLTAVLVLDNDGNTLATLVENTDYWKYPYNETIFDTIRLKPGGKYTRWPARKRVAKITGIFGRSSVPSPIKIAALKLAAKVINEGLRGGQVSGETLGSYRIDYEKIDEAVDSLGIKEILNQYRAITL